MSQSNNNKLNRYFVVLGGATMTTGGSLNLAKGQVGIFSNNGRKATKDGQPAIATFAGRDKDEDFAIKLGRGDVGLSRSTSNKPESSVPFSVKDVVKVGVSAPKTTEQQVDDVILGYNGIDPETAITLVRGDRKKITVELSGELIGMFGYPDNKFVTSVYLDPEKYFGTETCETGDNCEAVNAREYVLEAIEELRRFQMMGGVEMQEVVDITPVEQSVGAVEPVTEDRFYQTLTLNDTGDQAALAYVQAQYPENKIVRKEQSGISSVYETLTETDTLLTAYSQSLSSIIKGCEECPDGYDEIPGGYVYNITVEDDGADLTTTVDNIAGFVAGTADKVGNDGGKGIYTLITTDEVTDAQIATYIASTPVLATANVKLLGLVQDICDNTATTTTPWVLGDTCEVSSDLYTIVLADNECGENRLAELQAAYPDNNVVIAPSSTSARNIVFNGTSGTANVTVNGTNYLATFATNLTTTAANFVSTHAAAILAATGATVTSNGSNISFVHETTGFPTLAITNVTTNLAGTVGPLVALPSTGGCQTKYQASVITNMVCEECSPIFRDFFTSEELQPYDATEWEKVEPVAPTSSLMGIRFRGKKYEVRSNEYLRDIIGFTDSSVQIRVVMGQIDEVRLGIGELKDEPIYGHYLSRWEPRTHLGGNLQWLEQRDRVYFTGEEPHTDPLTRVLFTQEESVINQSLQYCDYSIEVKRSTYAQHPSLTHNETFVYHILVEVGRHQAVEALVNSLAAASGVPAVRAFGEIN